jgi:hypothetical protein
LADIEYGIDSGRCLPRLDPAVDLIAGVERIVGRIISAGFITEPRSWYMGIKAQSLLRRQVLAATGQKVPGAGDVVSAEAALRRHHVIGRRKDAGLAIISVLKPMQWKISGRQSLVRAEWLGCRNGLRRSRWIELGVPALDARIDLVLNTDVSSGMEMATGTGGPGAANLDIPKQGFAKLLGGQFIDNIRRHVRLERLHACEGANFSRQLNKFNITWQGTWD